LNRCRIGVHLSLYENACRSIYEFLRSDLPCVASRSMGGMNMELFNPQTGMVVNDDELPEAIRFVLMNRERYAPRQWFLDNSGSRRSTETLNELFARLSAKWGYEWSRDIVQLGSSGADRYVNKSGYKEFLPEFEIILKYFKQIDRHWGTFSVE